MICDNRLLVTGWWWCEAATVPEAVATRVQGSRQTGTALQHRAGAEILDLNCCELESLHLSLSRSKLPLLRHADEVRCP